jgi:hypothetical protein
MEMIIRPLTRLVELPPPTLQGEPGEESQDRSKSKHCLQRYRQGTSGETESGDPPLYVRKTSVRWAVPRTLNSL